VSRETRIPTFPALDESFIRAQSSAESFRRGQSYYRSRAVVSLVLRDDLLHAQVEGSRDVPYTVSIAFDRDGVTEAACSCPVQACRGRIAHLHP